MTSIVSSEVDLANQLDRLTISTHKQHPVVLPCSSSSPGRSEVPPIHALSFHENELQQSFQNANLPLKISQITFSPDDSRKSRNSYFHVSFNLVNQDHRELLMKNIREIK